MDWHNFVSDFESPDSVPAEYLIERIKIWRKQELSSTDFTQLPDVSVDKQAYANYRQSLRDLPSQGEDPRTWVFPIKP